MTCKNCHQELDANSEYCGYCGLPQNNVLFLSQFDQANEQISARKRKLEEGRTTKDEFDAAIKQIKLIDQRGRTWFVDPADGKWHRSKPPSVQSARRLPVVILPILGTFLVILVLVLLSLVFGSGALSVALDASTLMPSPTPMIVTRIITSVIEGPKSTPLVITQPVTVVVYPPTPSPVQITQVVPRPETVLIKAPTAPPVIVQVTQPPVIVQVTQPPVIVQITTTPLPIRENKYARPVPISPSNRAKIADRNQRITLRWQPVGVLLPEESYLVEVARDFNFHSSTVACSIRTKIAEVALPSEQRQPCNSLWSYNNIFYWRVSVVYEESRGDFRESEYSSVWSLGWNP